MGLAHGFEFRFNVAQISQAAFERVDRTLRITRDTGLFRFRLAAPQKPHLVLFERDVGRQTVVLLRHFGLTLQLLQVAVQLAQNVLDPGQIRACVAETVLGLAPAFLVLGHTGCFFQKQAQLLGLAFDDAADGSLANDGVGARPQTGAQEHVLHIAPAHRLVVDVVAAGAVAREHAPHGDLGELVPLATSTVVCVVEHQFHAGAAGRLTCGGAVENNVLHRLAAQLRRLGFAQDPAHRVHDVGLAAAIGTDHAHQLARQHEGRGLDEGLEAR